MIYVSYDRRSEHKKQKYGTKLCIRRQFPVRMKNLMCYYIVHDIYVCPNDYVLHACSAPSNLKGHSYVDTILVTTSGVAENTAAAGGNSKNLWHGGEGERWTKQSSI